MFRTFALMMCMALCSSIGRSEGDDALTFHTSEERLASISLLLGNVPTPELPTFQPAVSQLQILNRSPWRHSIRNAIHLLINSDTVDDRIAGWKLAQEWGESLDCKQADIDRLVDDPSEDVRFAALGAAPCIDAELISQAIERFLLSPRTSEEVKRLCVSLLNNVPKTDLRLRLWLKAAEDEALQAECVLTFAFVSFSELSTRVMLNWLDNKSDVHMAVSDHFSVPTELRVIACEQLRAASQHKDLVTNVLKKRCDVAPRKEDLRFFLAAMLTCHKLDPASSAPEDLLVKWYTALHEDRSEFLDRLDGGVAGLRRFEALVIATCRDGAPTDKCVACRWLSRHTSHESVTALAQLLRDPHQGVRVAAVVALAVVDPLIDLSALREELIPVAKSAPEEFSLGFQSEVDAVIALATAGQSDSDAVTWLNRRQTSDVQTICEEAGRIIQQNEKRVDSRRLPWKVRRLSY